MTEPLLESFVLLFAGGPLVLLVFRRLGPGVAAFREQEFARGGIGYPAVMHGLLEQRDGGRYGGGRRDRGETA